VKYTVDCNGNAVEVVAKAREVLSILVANLIDRRRSIEEWRLLLPKWFVAQCSEEPSPEEAEKKRKYVSRLTAAQLVEHQKTQKWSLESLVYSLEPEERTWYWWDAHVDSPDTITLLIRFVEWPFAPGDLKWIFRASGADSIEQDLDDFIQDIPGSEETGTGIMIPEDLWNKALPDLKRYSWPRSQRHRRYLPASVVVAIRLRCGTRIEGVVVSSQREILFRSTGLKGPEWTTEGLDFASDDIEAIGKVVGTFLGVWERLRWFTRS